MFKFNSIILLSLVVSQTVLANEAQTQSVLNQASHVFDQQQIKSHGVTNVYNLLNFVPGFQAVMTSNNSAHTQLQVRGVAADSGYVVLMVDGVKLNTLLINDVLMGSPYFDSTLAQTVEIYTGPNAVRFGNNAALAVINIITKKTNRLSIAGGDFNHQNASASLYRNTGYGEFSFFIMDTQGDGQQYASDNIPSASYVLGKDYINQPYKHDQFSINWQLGNYVLHYYSEEHQQDGFLNNQSYHQNNQFNSTNRFISNQYQYQLTDQFNVNAELTYGESEVKSVARIDEAGIRPFSEDYWFGPNWSSRKLDFNLMTNYTWSDTLSFEFGVQWQQQEQDKAGIVTSHLTPDGQDSLPLDLYYLDAIQSVTEYGPYTNLLQSIESHGIFSGMSWQMSPIDHVSAGIRLERNHGFADDVSTHIGYNRILNQKSHVSVEYSEAFRAPNFIELFSQDPYLHGNESLKPEKIRSYQLSYDYTEQDWNATVTAFYQQQSKVIALTFPDSSQRRFYNNLNNKDIFGLEAKGDYKLNQHIKLQGTLTHYFNDTYEQAFQTFATLSLLSQINRFTIGVNNILRSAVDLKAGLDSSDFASTGFNQNATYLVNAVVNYQLGRSILLSLKAENVFDQSHKVYDPSQTDNQLYVPQQTRFVSFTLTYEF
ncbi:TonB-dependent receptor [Psychrosphaera sp. F3M07]|uniref:TonB-dependent receptor n=1 Tax=Psychrosphaera sp. F3M07 TaxID=2841560 RepID=UPI001C096ADF|nr:TonB-dependent receptor [Psychrosphaera sp. F3M07]MBU2918588.1 TonB-dependent receptor [Psychrosphaera sp. F3M07]